MLHSLSLDPKGLVLDTNVLSLLAVAKQLALVRQIAVFPLYITPHILHELTAGLAHGIDELRAVFALIDGEQIQVLQLTPAEQTMLTLFPNKLARGEQEAIAICRHRNMVFITRDRKAANYCDREKIGCIRLKELLTQLVLGGLLTEQAMNHILA